MSSTTSAPTTAAATTDSTAAQNQTAAASTLTAEDQVKKDVENAGHGFLRRSLAWLKKEFEAVGLDIEAELKKL
jgi:hypothetical protein